MPDVRRVTTQPSSKVNVTIWLEGEEGRTAFLSGWDESNPVVKSRTDFITNLPCPSDSGYCKNDGSNAYKMLFQGSY